jgi:hypothetical protein
MSDSTKDDKPKSSLPWPDVNTKVEEYTKADGVDSGYDFVLDSLTLADFKDIPIEGLSILAAMRSVGTANDDIIAIEGTRIIEVALDQVRQEFFPDGDTSALKTQMNRHLFSTQLRDLMIAYASGEKTIPKPDFTDVAVEMGIKRRLN